ncbi:MAG: DNA-3-methyladenine glycosylase I [Pseudomonadota bacterium]
MKIQFETIWKRAVAQKGSEEAVENLLPDPLRASDLASQPDRYFLSEITKSVFKAGFVWSVIDQKWPAFEDAFFKFDVPTCIYLSPEDIDNLCCDERIVRNRQKILTVPKNAQMVQEISEEYGGFGTWLGQWPGEDFVGLLDYFKRNGSRMGGNSCQYFLRFVGKDGYILTDDVIRALIRLSVIDKSPTSRADKQRVQDAFNQLSIQSGLGLTKLSRLLALSVG